MVIPFVATLDNGKEQRFNASDLLPRATLCQTAVRQWNARSMGHQRARRVVRLEGVVARFDENGNRTFKSWDMDL